MLIGATTVSASDWGTTAAASGPFTARRSFNSTSDFGTTHGVPPTFAASAAHVDAGLDLVSFYSFKPDIVLMAGGTLDASVNGFLDSVPDGHRMAICSWHEPGPKVRQGTFTVAQWRAQFAHFADLVHEFGNPNIVVAYIDSAYQPTAPGTSYEDLWVDGAADIALFDGYTDLGSGDSVWLAGQEFAGSKNVPWGIAEIGTRTGSVSPDWMLAQTKWALDHDALCLLWFDTTTGGVAATPGTSSAATTTAHAISVLLAVDPDEFSF